MNDNDVLNYCFKDKNDLFHDNIVKNKIINMSKEMIDYLNNRFKDSQSLNESIYRIKLGIEKRPTCKLCGKPVQYLRKGLYREFCSCSCRGIYCTDQYYKQTGIKSSLCLDSVKQKTKETLIKKYGVDNISKNEQIKEKKKQTFINRFGYENNFCNKTILKKAVDNSIKSIDKRIKTCLKKYGVKHYGNTLKGKHIPEEIKQKISKTLSSKEFQLRRYNIMKQNNSFITSKLEENVYKELLSNFDKIDIIRQYKSIDYPWRCDFYVKSLNTYIEVQGSQFHHFHPFNENNQEDIKELNRLKSLANNNQYDSIIFTWTIGDVNKRNTAKNNNLKYVEIFPSDNYKEIIQNLIINKTSGN